MFERMFERMRGAIMVETALTMSAVLTLTLGAIQLGIVGFLQVTVDAAAFLNAHENSIGVTDPSGPADATHRIFPQVQASSIATVIEAAPTPLVPVDYLYNGTTAEQANSSTNRHGGADMMQPYLQQTNIKQTPFTFLGAAYPVQSQATEATWLLSEKSWDVANTNYGTAYSSTNTSYDENYFTQGVNNPVYYMNFNWMAYCATPGAWGTPASGARGTCPTGALVDLGVAEYLNIYNWNNPQPGVDGPANSTSAGGTTGTFEAMACHQREYAIVADFLLAEYKSYPTTAFNQLQSLYNPYHNNQTGYTNFNNANFFPGTAANTAVQTIYKWDYGGGNPNGPVVNGNFPNPPNPTGNCT